MKKRLFMAFTLSMFIVSIMSAAAMAAKPTFSNGSDISSAVSALVYNNDGGYNLTLTATASPDLTKVTVDNKTPIAGITITVGNIEKGEGDTQSSCEVTIAGTPTEAVKGKKVTVTATNKDGDTKLKLTFNSTAEGLEISTVSGTLPGNSEALTVTQGTKLANVVVRALPGPVTWKAKDLPKGITTKVSGDTDLVLSGTYSGLTAYSKAIGATSADAKKSHFTLTAKNKAVTEDAETSGDIFVVTSPDTKMKSFPALTLGKEYKAQIKMVNYPKSIAVYFGQNESEAKTSTVETTEGIKDISETSIGVLELTSDDKGWYITGSCDRMPLSGSIYARIAATGQNDVEVSNVATLQIPFKGVAPAFDKPDNLNFDEGDIVFQISKGTKPIVVSIDLADKVRKSYGSSKDVTIIGGSTSESGSTVDWDELGFSVTTTMGGANDDFIWKATLTPKNATDDTLAEAYKGLKLTLKATNPVTGTTKVVKKDFGISKNADTEVKWTNAGASGNPDASSTEVTGNTINVKNQKGGEDLAANDADQQAIVGGEELPSDVLKALQFYTNVPKPYTIALSGDKAVNGLSVGFEAGDDGGGVLSITGTPTKSKDTVTKFKLVATNTLTKKKAQVNVNISAYAEPAFTNAKDLAAGKEVVAGKKVSIKGKMKAHKDLLPTVTYSELETDTSEAFTATGLEFTSDAKGAFEIAGAAGETKPTLNDAGTAYDSKDVTIKWKDAFNGIEEQSATVKLRIKPLQPKIKTSKVVYTMTADEDTNTEQSIELSNITSETVGTSLKYGPTALFDGAALAEDTGVITFTKASLTPTKSKAVNVSVDNYGVKSATKSVKFTINAPKPVVTAGAETVDIAGSATDKVEKTVTFTASSETTGGDTKLKWKISTKPDGLGAKIKAASDTKSATVTITAKKGSTASGAITLGVTATNTVSKEESEEVTVTINATAAPEKSSATKDGETRDKDTATDEATEPMKEEDVEVGEGEVILGKARTEAALTAEQRTRIAEAGYVVVAVLPEVEVTAPGQYPLPVEIPEEIAAGKELAWFAFSTKPSEDDEIVDFFDEEGKDTKVVPESHKITVYPWLNADVTYVPVIAVKADTGEKGAETEEQIKEKTVRAVKK